MISQPTENSCHSTSTPESASPLRNTPTIRAPTSVPTIEPRPPNRLAPPTTTPAMLSRLARHADRGVGVEFGGGPALRTDRADPPDQRPRAERADHARRHIDREQDAPGADAGEPRRIGIVADRVEMAAERGAVEHEPDQSDQGQHEERAVGEAGTKNVDRRSQGLQERRGFRHVLRADGLGGGIPEIEREEDRPGAERHNEGRQLEPRYQDAVDRAAASTGRDAGQECERS